MDNRKRSFFERITGSIGMKEDYYEEPPRDYRKSIVRGESPRNDRIDRNEKKISAWVEEETEEAELAVDVYETPSDIFIQTMVAGVKPDDLELSVARDMITIRGLREENRNIDEESYFTKELYWGAFSRTISLPQEVEPEEVEATEKHGLLTIKIKKVDKGRKNTVRVRSI